MPKGWLISPQQLAERRARGRRFIPAWNLSALCLHQWMINDGQVVQ